MVFNMIELNIPGRGTFQLDHLVCDVNGTLAVDGRLIPGVQKALLALRDRLELHLLTADTHGAQERIDRRLGLQGIRIPAGDEAQAKAKYVKELDAKHVVAIGQGVNDRGMLEQAAIGICLLSQEGLATEAMHASDLIVTDILIALDLLEHPMRLVATLRR
jgi:P-type E1-E2 ATPase